MYDHAIEQKAICEFHPHRSVVQSVDINQDCATVLTGSSDGSCRIFDMRARVKEKQLGTVHNAVSDGTVYQVRWCGEFEFLSAGDDYCIKRWDLRKISSNFGSAKFTNALLTNYFGHTSDIRGLEVEPTCGDGSKNFSAFNPGGGGIGSGSSSGPRRDSLFGASGETLLYNIDIHNIFIV